MIDMGTIVAISSIVALIGIATLLIMLRIRQQAYEGVVARKDEVANTDDDGPDTYYYLVIDTQDGKSKSVRVHRKTWDQFAVGDRIIKRPGKLSPEHA